MRNILVILSSLFVMSCSNMHLKNIDNVPVSTGTKKSSVEKSIEMAAANRGWVVTKKTANNYRLTLQVRTHTLVVDLPYSSKSYSIKYVSSENLNYVESKGIIHKQAYRWMNNLRRDINVFLIKN